MRLLPRRSDYTDARNNNNSNNNATTNRQARGKTALDAILDADDSSDDEEEPPGMDWSANWIQHVNEGDGDAFRARLNSTTWKILLLEGSLISMIMVNQQEAYHL
jgi:hypothetical protein